MAGGMGERLPKAADAAFIVACLLVGLTFLASALTSQFAALIVVPVFVIGGIGITRRRVWSAYGLALFEAAPLPVLLVAAARGTVPISPFQLTGTLLIALVLVLVFFMAGRSLAAVGGPEGHAVPWIALSVFIAAFAIPLIWLQGFMNPTGSMENTMLVGDSILVKRPLNRPPVRGDIVVFHYPVDRRQTFMKRVVGISGDRIKIVNKQTFLNGNALLEPYAVFRTAYIAPYRDNFPSEANFLVDQAARKMLRNNVLNGEVLIPPGSYFVLGDNRDYSSDSRYWGFVPEEDVIGKPVMIYWSREMKPDGGGSIRWNRIFKPI
jgi:signal peptidase I